jgi:hypothetical protein
VFPVVLRRGVKLSPVVGYVGGQLGALPPKGLAFVRGSGHVANDSAGGKEARGEAGRARQRFEGRGTPDFRARHTHGHTGHFC